MTSCLVYFRHWSRNSINGRIRIRHSSRTGAGTPTRKQIDRETATSTAIALQLIVNSDSKPWPWEHLSIAHTVEIPSSTSTGGLYSICYSCLLADIALSQLPILSRQTNILPTHWWITSVLEVPFTSWLAMEPSQRHPRELMTFSDTYVFRIGRASLVFSIRTMQSNNRESSRPSSSWSPGT